MAISNLRAANFVRNASASRISFKGNTLKINLGSYAKQIARAPKLTSNFNRMA